MPRLTDILRVWNTHEPPPAGFAEAWTQRLARAPHHNFAMTLEWIQWEAKHGRHSRVALVDEKGVGGAIVMREEHGEWHCGWPWRWQCVVDDPARDGAVGMDVREARWLFEHASRLARPKRLRFFAPAAPPEGVPSFMAGGTLLQSLGHGDQDILMAMDATKRRTTRRAREQGCEVVEANTPELWRGFAEVQVETKTRHGDAPPAVEAAPGPGEHWREWELPWMWLIVAVREGRVVSGFGLGLAPGGMLEGRTSATNEVGRKIGAFPLLVYEASLRARDRGYRWHNNGGDTFFKRDMLGKFAERVDIHCWLGGGARWVVANQGEALGRRLAPRVRRLQKRFLAATKPRKG